MRVFVTGASGHIGSAVVPELLRAGHSVVGLARSDAAATAIRKVGADIVRGDLDDLDLLRASAKQSDGVIHLAFKHDIGFSGGFDKALAADRQAIEAMGGALEGSNKPFVGTSGSLMLAMHIHGRTGTEDDALPGGHRVDAENAVVALATRGVRSSVIRLAPTVHSDLDKHGFISAMVGMARKNGFAAYIGDGANRWPALHTLDAATLYRLALEDAPAGSRLHGIDDEGVPFKAIAEAIGRGAGVPAKSVSPDEAPQYLGFLGMFAQLDNPTSNRRTRELLNWNPTHPGLLADLAEKHYFAQ